MQRLLVVGVKAVSCEIFLLIFYHWTCFVGEMFTAHSL